MTITNYVITNYVSINDFQGEKHVLMIKFTQDKHNIYVNNRKNATILLQWHN